MTFESALKSHLATEEIGNLVDERIHPMLLPEGSSKPAITYQIVSDGPQTDLDGGDGALNNIRVQVDCWAGKPDDAKALAELVRIRMKTAAASFHAVPLPMFESYEPDAKLFRVSRDFSCWYRIS